jgi:hypothetical protein
MIRQYDLLDGELSRVVRGGASKVFHERKAQIVYAEDVEDALHLFKSDLRTLCDRHLSDGDFLFCSQMEELLEKLKVD